MNITLTSLEALILKATNESLPAPDSAAIEAFLAIMKDSTDGPQLAAQALAARIQSNNPRESMLALSMLDCCMKRGDVNFQAEIGKFRFLNEMIKLVSPKYLADRTAKEVRTRVLQLFHTWSVEYPKESKFKVAYDMLKNQGVIKEPLPPLTPDEPPQNRRSKNTIFEDDEKSKLLQKLLQSKKPEDLQHANRLIKTMVREEERRNEAVSRRVHEVSSALDSAGLLREMLQQACNASPEELQLITELYDSCCALRPTLQSLAAEHLNQDGLDDIIHASDVLDEVFKEYNTFIKNKKTKPLAPRQSTNGESLLDFAGASSQENDLNKTNNTNTIADLDIFASEACVTNIVEPLKPLNLLPKDDVAILLEDKPDKKEGWNELDSLSEQLLKQSLPENVKRIDNFASRTTKKTPMNALEKPSRKPETNLQNNEAILDLDFFSKPVEQRMPMIQTPVQNLIDDVMIEIGDSNTNTNKPNDNIKIDDNVLDNIVNTPKPSKNISNDTSPTKVDNKTLEMKPLTDIDISVESVKPSKMPSLTAFEEEDGISVILHFCEDKPRRDVDVFVVSTTSKKTTPIEDYKFQAVVPKGCKIRLLSPSGNVLPAFRPFLPPPALTQLMLISRPPSTPITLKYIFTYSCDNDTCSEIGEVLLPPMTLY